MPARLVDRHPMPATEALVEQLVPPPLFAGVRFDNYRPDPAEPSQSAALAAARQFAGSVAEPGGRRWFGRVAGPGRSRFGRGRGRQGPSGLYLDGGFGVGKTHLLAALWHAVPGPKAYATFAELAQLAGVLGFAELTERLAGMRLLAIDEFELDDPGDTVLISSLLARLDGFGVRFAATSNTVPDRLGEQRFAAEDFRREIQSMAARFATVRVDGPDYRHRGLPVAPRPLSAEQVLAAASRPGASLDDFPALLEHLATLHPTRYAALLGGISEVCLLGVLPVSDENVALRLVVLADRLYDRQLAVSASGVPVDRLFGEQLLVGGYRMKYRRAISRLVALARLSSV